MINRCDRCWQYSDRHNPLICDETWTQYCNELRHRENSKYFMTNSHTTLYDEPMPEEDNMKKPRKTIAENVRCPECNSAMTYFRIRVNTHHCRNCGEDFSHAKVNHRA